MVSAWPPLAFTIRARVPEVVLEDPPQVWQAKLKIDGPPCVFVFNRAGGLIKRFHDDVDYPEIERIVMDALKEKP